MRQKLYPCSICKYSNFEEIYSGVFHFYKLRISICKNCGAVYQNPRMSQAFFDKYYSGKKYYGRYQPRIDISKKPNVLDGSRSALIYNHIKSHTRNTSTILEIGSGLGDTLISLKSKGYKQLYATEINIEGVRRLRAFKIKCYHGNLKKFCKENNKKYDFIILSHVLEHFVKPDDALVQIRNLLNQEGYLYILLPNFYSGNNPYSQFTLPHTLYFTENTLSKLLKSLGFKIIKKYTQDISELAIICKKTIIKRYNPADNQYSEIKRYLKKYNKPRLTKKELLAKKLISFIPPSLYDYIVDVFS